MDNRLKQLTHWAQTVLKDQSFDIKVASADASFRRYFRIRFSDQSYIAMDAPPDKENCGPFIRIASALSALGVHTPRIHAHDVAQGFILLEDLGSADYLSKLRKNSSNADDLYHDAIRSLLNIQTGSQTPDTSNTEISTKNENQAPPYYSDSMLCAEMDLFQEWYLERHLNIKLNHSQHTRWLDLKVLLSKACTEQPQVWVHRDFHSRNLMVTTQNNPGVIDFQDLVIGPISYDLASLFKDCYIEWPRKRQLEYLSHYYKLLENPTFSVKQLIQWYDLTGLQRHLKVLGIFCRLHYRDNKHQYLADLPLVAKYVIETLDLYSDKLDVVKRFKEEFETTIKRAM